MAIISSKIKNCFAHKEGINGRRQNLAPACDHKPLSDISYTESKILVPLDSYLLGAALLLLGAAGTPGDGTPGLGGAALLLLGAAGTPGDGTPKLPGTALLLLGAAGTPGDGTPKLPGLSCGCPGNGCRVPGLIPGDCGSCCPGFNGT